MTYDTDAILRVVAYFGTQRAFSKAVGVSPEAVRKWVHGEQRITAERALQIETVTKGEVTRYELRPDLFNRRSIRRAS